MKGIATNSTPFSANKFRTLNLVENSVVLIKKNKEVTNISFSELDKIYIQKHTFSFLDKIGLFSMLLIATFLFFIYLSIELVLLESILAIILIAKMNTYRRYKLNLLLNDGTLFIKKLKKDSKHHHINLVNLVRKEIFDNRVKFNFQKKNSFN